jgi:hypothetical protein
MLQIAIVITLQSYHTHVKSRSSIHWHVSHDQTWSNIFEGYFQAASTSISMHGRLKKEHFFFRLACEKKKIMQELNESM